MKYIALVLLFLGSMTQIALAGDNDNKKVTTILNQGPTIQYLIKGYGVMGPARYVFEFTPKMAPRSVCVVVVGEGISCFEPQHQRTANEVLHNER